MTRTRNRIAITALLGLTGVLCLLQPQANAATYSRQYYSNWTYQASSGYYFTRYYYRPVVRTNTYSYHYVLYYPSQPRYRYYYNPVRRVFWGRFEVDEQGKPVGYSLLQPEDRKENLSDIPAAAFPEPGKMPVIPGAQDGRSMTPPPTIESEARSPSKSRQRSV